MAKRKTKAKSPEEKLQEILFAYLFIPVVAGVIGAFVPDFAVALGTGGTAPQWLKGTVGVLAFLGTLAFQLERNLKVSSIFNRRTEKVDARQNQGNVVTGGTSPGNFVQASNARDVIVNFQGPAGPLLNPQSADEIVAFLAREYSGRDGRPRWASTAVIGAACHLSDEEVDAICIKDRRIRRSTGPNRDRWGLRSVVGDVRVGSTLGPKS